jgi:hypothetical protein
MTSPFLFCNCEWNEAISLLWKDCRARWPCTVIYSLQGKKEEKGKIKNIAITSSQHFGGGPVIKMPGRQVLDGG